MTFDHSPVLYLVWGSTSDTWPLPFYSSFDHAIFNPSPFYHLSLWYDHSLFLHRSIMWYSLPFFIIWACDIQPLPISLYSGSTNLWSPRFKATPPLEYHVIGLLHLGELWCLRQDTYWIGGEPDEEISVGKRSDATHESKSTEQPSLIKVNSTHAVYSLLCM